VGVHGGQVAGDDLLGAEGGRRHGGSFGLVVCITVEGYM
jgi:hypothetical protein